MYVRVKLANVLFTYELARRLADSGVTVNAVDPGGARTQLIENTTADMLPPLMRLIFPLIKRFGLTSIASPVQPDSVLPSGFRGGTGRRRNRPRTAR